MDFWFCENRGMCAVIFRCLCVKFVDGQTTKSTKINMPWILMIPQYMPSFILANLLLYVMLMARIELFGTYIDFQDSNASDGQWFVYLSLTMIIQNKDNANNDNNHH